MFNHDYSMIKTETKENKFLIHYFDDNDLDCCIQIISLRYNVHIYFELFDIRCINLCYFQYYLWAMCLNCHPISVNNPDTCKDLFYLLS